MCLDWLDDHIGEKGVLITVISLVIIGIVACFFLLSFLYNGTYVGQRYDVTIEVQAVEQSTRFGDHTNVWAKVYGNQDITYIFFGHQQLDIGKTYRIVFVDDYAVYYFEVWGRVEKIEEVKVNE
jgi:hypothetical protein